MTKISRARMTEKIKRKKKIDNNVGRLNCKRYKITRDETFPGATTECMKDYVKPTMKYNPDFVILHTGTNDLKSNKSSEEISNDIIKLALDIKTDQNDIVVSGILARNDDMKKVKEVNNFLKIKRSTYGLAFLNNLNIVPKKHLNGSGVHINYNRTVALGNNFLKIINV